MEAAANHPDYPMWSSLLRWSLAQPSDGTTPSPNTPMSEEKRRFLEAALKSLGEDAAAQQAATLGAITAFLEDPESDGSPCVHALERLEDDAVDLDAARDLLKAGALALVLRCCAASNGAVSSAACGVVAAAAQNDPEVQAGGGADAVEALLSAYRRSAAEKDDAWGRRALSAITASTRNAGAVEDAFVRDDAAQVLGSAIRRRTASSDGLRLAAKGAFALKALLEDDATRAPALSSAVAAALSALLAPPVASGDAAADAARLQIREHATRAALLAKCDAATLAPAIAATEAALGDPKLAAACDAEGVADQRALWRGAVEEMGAVERLGGRSA